MKKIFLYSFIAITLLSGASTSYAQGKYTLLEPLPCIGAACGAGEVMTKIDINSYIEYVFKFALALAVFLAVVVIIYGGFEYVLSGIPAVKVSGKERIFNAIKGLICVLIAYLLLATIDPRLVQVNTAIPKLPVGDPNYAADFQSMLTGDLNKLNVEDKAGITATQAHNSELQKSIDFLKNKEAEAGLTPQEEINLQNFKAESKRNEAEITKKTYRFVGAANFSNAVAMLQNNVSYEAVSTHDGVSDPAKLSDGSKAALENFDYQIESYKKYADQLKNNGDFEGAAQVIARGQFYLEQIKAEQTLMKDILTYNHNKSEKTSSKTLASQLALKEELAMYSKPETVDPSGKRDEELFKEYDTIKKQRVTLIKQTLGL